MTERHYDRNYRICTEYHVCENCINLDIGTMGDHDTCKRDGEEVSPIGTCNDFEKEVGDEI